MFDFFFPTEGMGSQTLRLVAEAGEGGGDVFEIARVCREIEPGNHESWERRGLQRRRIPRRGRRSVWLTDTNVLQ